MLTKRLKRYLARNRGHLIKSVLADTAARAYCKPYVRAITRPFFASREPSFWLFPVGCYNSGTTVTRDLLAMHPDIRGLPLEGVRFTSVLPRPEDLGWTRMWAACMEYMRMPETQGSELYRAILKDWAPWWREGGSVFMDKSISNLTRIEWLDQNFPNARFIGIIRNGYCATEGVLRRAKPSARARELLGQDAYPVEMVARQWVLANQILLEYANSSRNILLIKYEDLVIDPVSVLSEIWKFLGLVSPRMRPYNNGVEIGSTRFSLRDMNPESIARLSPHQVAKANQVLSDMQNRLGYPVL